jgi:hypothetical protein
VPSLERLAALTGWRPSTPLSSIVAEVVAAHRAGEGAPAVIGPAL